jgi:endoplasmic reticulum-Golgi intermediate compartment protein 3
MMQATVIPGLFFIYELSPFMVEYTHGAVPLAHLVTRLLAIVGGVFSVMGVLDIVSFRLTKMATKSA